MQQGMPRGISSPSSVAAIPSKPRTGSTGIRRFGRSTTRLAYRVIPAAFSTVTLLQSTGTLILPAAPLSCLLNPSMNKPTEKTEGAFEQVAPHRTARNQEVGDQLRFAEEAFVRHRHVEVDERRDFQAEMPGEGGPVSVDAAGERLPPELQPGGLEVEFVPLGGELRQEGIAQLPPVDLDLLAVAPLRPRFDDPVLAQLLSGPGEKLTSPGELGVEGIRFQLADRRPPAPLAQPLALEVDAGVGVAQDAADPGRPGSCRSSSGSGRQILFGFHVGASGGRGRLTPQGSAPGTPARGGRGSGPRCSARPHPGGWRCA